MTNIQKIVFIIILLLAIILRFYKLDQVPPSLFSDEVDLGYQAYSILKTGKDYKGNFFPIHFQSFADFRSPLYIYSSIPTLAIFGLNEWGVRIPAALFGTVSLVGLFLLIRKLGFNTWVALSSIFLLSISPWHLHYSRAGFEVTLMLLLIICGLWWFLKGLEIRVFLIFSSVAFILATLTYSTAKLFVPLFGFSLMLIYRKQLLKLSQKWKVGMILLLIALSIPLIIDTVSGKASYRFSYTNIFANPTIPKEIDVQRNIDTGSDRLGMQPTILSKINHNKVLSYGESFIKNYSSSFSTQFLFLDGDPIRRHSIGKMGQFYLFEIVTICLGLFILLKIKTKAALTLITWILLSPIPASLTVEGGNHATRLILLLIPLIILSGVGLENILNFILSKKIPKLSFLAIFLIIIASLYFYLHHYFVHYPLEQERIWHYGFKQAILKSEKIKDNFDSILFTTSIENPLPFILFWTKYSPDKFQEFNGSKFRLGNYVIGSINDKELVDRETLIVAASKDLPKKNLTEVDFEGYKLLDTVKYPSGEVVFFLLTNHE